MLLFITFLYVDPSHLGFLPAEQTIVSCFFCSVTFFQLALKAYHVYIYIYIYMYM